MADLHLLCTKRPPATGQSLWEADKAGDRDYDPSPRNLKDFLRYRLNDHLGCTTMS